MKKVQTPLFQGITENEWNEMQNCSCMRQQSFEKNELIFRMGESVREIGIVLTGSVNIENVDFWGNKKSAEQHLSRTSICRNLRFLSGAFDGECSSR